MAVYRREEILTGAGPVEVAQGRIGNNSPDPASRVRFTPSVLPAYLRRTDTIEELIPGLYLKGISTGDFGGALQALVGERAKGLSPNVIVCLKEQWADEYDQWSSRDLSDKQYVYFWADGIYAKVRLEDDANKKQCLLVPSAVLDVACSPKLDPDDMRVQRPFGARRTFDERQEARRGADHQEAA